MICWGDFVVLKWKTKYWSDNWQTPLKHTRQHSLMKQHQSHGSVTKWGEKIELCKKDLIFCQERVGEKVWRSVNSRWSWCDTAWMLCQLTNCYNRQVTFINFWLINSKEFLLPADTVQQFLSMLIPLLLATQTCQIETTGKTVWPTEFLVQVSKSDNRASLPDVR